MPTLPPLLIERLAEAIHERFRRNQAGRKPASDGALRAWDELSEALKDSNRSQAEDILRKLDAIGCVVSVGMPLDGFAFTGPELERLAEMEHRRWVAERRRNGWTLGSTRDPDRRVTPWLMPYDELPEEIREYDREAVRAIPDLLRELGLGIRRIP